MHALLRRLAAHRRRARTAAALHELSDRQLADIGLRRFDIDRVADRAAAPFERLEAGPTAAREAPRRAVPAGA